MQTTELFHHTPLDGHIDIRIVELLPGNEDEMVSMRLVVQAGRDAIEHEPNCQKTPGGPLIEYIALSYTWGDPSTAFLVLLDGQLFYVRENLYNALRQFRRPTGQRSLHYWIDAICINQDDVSERNAQVRRMARIYEDAKEIHAWLGPEAEDSQLAMRRIAAMASWALRFMTSYESNVLEMFNMMRSNEFRNMIFEDSDGPLDERPWVAIRQLLRRTWWTRVWIVQEFTVDKVPTFVICGSERIERKAFIGGCFFISFLDEDANYSAIKASGIDFTLVNQLVMVHGERFAGRGSASVLRLIYELRHYKATDRRDKVNAVLGMASDAGRTTHLLPDYSISPLEISYDVVRHQVESADYPQKLDFLGYARKAFQQTFHHTEGASTSPSPDLPSWLPDWFTQREEDFVPFPMEKHARNFSEGYPRNFSANLWAGSSDRQTEPWTPGALAYSASGTTARQDLYVTQDSTFIAVREKELRLKGLPIGYLFDLSSQFVPMTGEQYTVIQPDWVTRYYTDTTYSLTGEPYWNVIPRVVVADIQMNTDHATGPGQPSRRSWLPTAQDGRVPDQDTLVWM